VSQDSSVRRLGPVLLAAALAAGCGGGPPADLFVVSREGSIPGARLTLRITDDGGAYCNDLGRREISSSQLIEARALRRALDGERDEDGLAARRLALPPREGSILRYRVRSEAGTVRFADTSARQPQALFRLAKLVRDVAKGPCGLVR
jgi:hypothetical protein